MALKALAGMATLVLLTAAAALAARGNCAWVAFFAAGCVSLVALYDVAEHDR